MKEQFDKLIQLAKDYKEFGASINHTLSWVTLYGYSFGQGGFLEYKPDTVGEFEVETYFADNYNTFMLGITTDGNQLSINDYSSKIEIPYDITEDFLKVAVEKLTVVLTLWKEYVGVLSKEDIAIQRQNEIEVLRARLSELEKL